MEGYVKIISKEILMKPSHPKPIKLSYIDRSLPSIYIPLLFFYKADENYNNLQISQTLKHSLLALLPSFFPLAGRLKHNHVVECNDAAAAAGVEFIHAQVHHQLGNVEMSELKHYLPSEYATFHHGHRRPLLVVQITFFDCGGLVVAACISHKIADLASAMAFLTAWAARCRGQPENVPRLTFGTHPYFPALNFIPFSLFTRFFKSNETFVTRKFVFGKEKLEILKRVATSSPESAVEDPTRVELVSAFIWKHFMGSRLKNDGHAWRKTFAAIMAVNLRPRTSPAGVLQNVFGNCFMSPLAFAGRRDSSRKFHRLISKLRRAIQGVKGGYITKTLNKESYLKDLVKMGILLMAGKLEWCYFTSWRGFPIYELDYGWGKPCGFGTPSMPIKNLVVLVNSKSGDDIEAIVTMKQEQLQMLEAQISLINSTTDSIM